MKTIELKLGQFDFDDGGTYVGGCDGGKANGYGVCTGPMGQGEFSGLWQGGFEVSGVFSWSKDNKYAGQWMQGKRHGLGIENKGHWTYMGEWTQGTMGRYGVRKSTKSQAKYEGTWTQGLQDGYGLETYADMGTYQGQWMKGSRHGFGVRKSASYMNACFIQDHGKRKSSLTSIRSSYDITAVGTPQSEAAGERPDKSHLDADMMRATKIGHFLASSKYNVAFKQIYEKNESGGSFKKRSRSAIRFLSDILKPKNSKQNRRLSDRGLKNQNITSLKSNGSTRQQSTEVDGNSQNSPNAIFFLGVSQIDNDAIEIYAGEWKHDKRDGFGVCERSDGTKYEGEWVGNRRNGYGITYYADGLKEEGRYKDDILLTDGHQRKWLNGLILAKKKREREKLAAAVAAAQKAAQLANQKSDIANSRMESARTKALLAEDVKNKAFRDAEKAKSVTVEIRKIELENEINANKSSMKLTKKPSIPRHQMMNQNHNFQPNQISVNQQPALNYDADEFYANTFKQFNNTKELLIKPLRPNSLKLHSHNPSHTDNFLMTVTSIESNETLNSISNSMPYISQNPSVLKNETDHAFLYSNSEEQKADNMFKNNEENNSQNVQYPNLMTIGKNDNSNELYSNFSYNNTRLNDLNLSGLAFVSNTVRRLTLPSIVKLKDISVQDSSPQTLNHQRTTNENDNKKSMGSNILILDGGDRKIIEQIENKDVVLPKITDLDFWHDKPSELPKIMKIHEFKTSNLEEHGSMPDMSRMKNTCGTLMSWQDMELLCQQTREELKRKKELEMNLRKRSIVIRLGDFKCWVKENYVLLVVITINISFIYLFISLMNH